LWYPCGKEELKKIVDSPDGKFKKVSKKRVGIKGMKAPARDHMDIYDATGEHKIG
jgi:aminomethyltransferase